MIRTLIIDCVTLVSIFSFNKALARARLDLEVPTEVPNISLISLWVYPSKTYKLNVALYLFVILVYSPKVFVN